MPSTPEEKKKVLTRVRRIRGQIDALERSLEGIGKISYVVAGILILGTVENAMNLLNISPFAQYVVRGLILLAAVIFDRYKQKAKRTV